MIVKKLEGRYDFLLRTGESGCWYIARLYDEKDVEDFVDLCVVGYVTDHPSLSLDIRGLDIGLFVIRPYIENNILKFEFYNIGDFDMFWNEASDFIKRLPNTMSKKEEKDADE
jgi:hypothetical protein